MDGLEAMKQIRTKEAIGIRSLLDSCTDVVGAGPLRIKPSEVADQTGTVISLPTEIDVTKYFHQNIVACSANGDDATVQEALQCGADAFISKYF